MPHHFPPALLALPLALGLLGGCTGELRMLAGSDGGTSDLQVDLATAMGDGPIASSLRFAPTIQKDLDDLGCSALSACHGGSAIMSLRPKAVTGEDLARNYDEVKLRASNGADSLLLRKTLEGSGLNHLGLQPFKNKTNETYLRWLEWVNAGAPSGLETGDAGVPRDGGDDGGA